MAIFVRILSFWCCAGCGKSGWGKAPQGAQCPRCKRFTVLSANDAPTENPGKPSPGMNDPKK